MLIHAAAGGVGKLAVQLAKWKGAHVIGTASKRNQDSCKSLGADETIDYQTTRFEEVIHEVDVVFDTIGGETQKRSWKVLKRGGILISIVGPPSEKEASAHGVRQAPCSSNRQPRSSLSLQSWSIRESLSPLSKPFCRSRTRRAHELSQTGHTRGKMVLKVL